eukprot:15476382-Alexandrium_andersonii.AAC.1
MYNRRKDLGKPDPSLPRDPRVQARQQKRIAGSTPPSTPRETKKQQTKGALVPAGRAAQPAEPSTGRT